MRGAATVDSQWWRKLIRWPAFLAANLALFLLIGISTVRETYRGWTVDREIRALESQAESLEGRKVQLAGLSGSLGSTDRIEREARTRLGWKKPGERVIVLTGWNASTGSGMDSGIAGVPSEPDPRAWHGVAGFSSCVDYRCSLRCS